MQLVSPDRREAELRTGPEEELSRTNRQPTAGLLGKRVQLS